MNVQDIPAINASNSTDLPVAGRINYVRDDPTTPTNSTTGAGGEQFGCHAEDYAFNNFQDGQIAVVPGGDAIVVQDASHFYELALETGARRAQRETLGGGIVLSPDGELVANVVGHEVRFWSRRSQTWWEPSATVDQASAG